LQVALTSALLWADNFCATFGPGGLKDAKDNFTTLLMLGFIKTVTWCCFKPNNFIGVRFDGPEVLNHPAGLEKRNTGHQAGICIV
jgi:hypothetical protein